MNKLASIIIPVYNTGLYLKECLDSVLGQSYKNIEVLIVEDGSTDKSGELCDSYCHDSRVTVFHQPNRGVSAARNLALEHAKGDYIFFADPDDFFTPDLVSSAVGVLKDTNADIVIFDYYEYVYKKSRYIRKLKKATARFHEDLISIQEDILIDSGTVWAFAYRSSLWKSIRFPEGENLEDMAVIPHVFLSAKQIVLLHKPLYYYRIHNKSYIHRRRYDPGRKYLEIERLFQRIPLAESFKDSKILERLYAHILRNCIELMYVNYCFDELDAGQLRKLSDFIFRDFDSRVLNRLSCKYRLLRQLLIHAPSLARRYGKIHYQQLNRERNNS